MINSVVLVGRITKDPELKSTQSNVNFCNFTLAVNRQYKDENGEQGVDFLNCIVWRKQSENLVQFVKKGHLLGVQGKIQTRTYEADNGTKYITEIVVDSVQFLETKGNNNYPQTDEEIDETFKHGNPTNPPKILTKAQVREEADEFYETSKKLAAEEDLPF